MAVNFPDTPNVGQVHSEGGANWRWSGYAWRRIPDPGAKGEPGAKGDQGDKGDVGLTGPQGDKGDKGAPSTVAGAKGDKGDKGVDGSIGSDGDKGDKGIKGEPSTVKGNKGDQGDQGEKGIDGAAAAKGQKGEDGDKGQKGEIGTVGDKGIKGEPSTVKGDKGDKGSQGGTGGTGNKGDKGDQGDKGSTGVGQKGETGDKGLKGATGAGDKGEPGTAAAKGDKGDKGTQGGDGADGVKGDKGESIKGDKGSKGEAGSDSYESYISSLNGNSQVEFTNIPSWATKITLIGENVLLPEPTGGSSVNIGSLLEFGGSGGYLGSNAYADLTSFIVKQTDNTTTSYGISEYDDSPYAPYIMLNASSVDGGPLLSQVLLTFVKVKNQNKWVYEGSVANRKGNPSTTAEDLKFMNDFAGSFTATEAITKLKFYSFQATTPSFTFGLNYSGGTITTIYEGESGSAGAKGDKGEPSTVQGDKGQKGEVGAQTFTVTNSSSSAYLFTGPGGLTNGSNSTIYLARGQTYEFAVNASGHPFYIQTSSGTYNSSNVYNTGVTNNGAETTTLTFEVPFSAPNTLYYACGASHASMVGSLVIYPSI